MLVGSSYASTFASQLLSNDLLAAVRFRWWKHFSCHRFNPELHWKWIWKRDWKLPAQWGYIPRAIRSSCQLLVLGHVTTSFHHLFLPLAVQLSHAELMPAIMEDTVSTTTFVCARLDLADMTVWHTMILASASCMHVCMWVCVKRGTLKHLITFTTAWKTCNCSGQKWAAILWFLYFFCIDLSFSHHLQQHTHSQPKCAAMVRATMTASAHQATTAQKISPVSYTFSHDTCMYKEQGTPFCILLSCMTIIRYIVIS